MHVSRLQSIQDGPPGLSDASQYMLIEALPPVLILHLKRFRYDAAAGGVIKIGKPVKFSSELEIPFGALFIFTPAAAETKNTS
jgi:ubiquitin carboxyl-terminal hydrolase 10